MLRLVISDVDCRCATLREASGIGGAQSSGGAVNLARRLYEFGGHIYLAPLLRREARQFGPEINEGAVQYALALRTLTDRAAHDVLDVGTGLSAWPSLLAGCGFRVTAVDEFSRYWGAGRPFNRHFLVQQDDITRSRLAPGFDALTCLNVMMAITN